MLSQLFPPQFPYCGDDPVLVPWLGWVQSGGWSHPAMAAPADTPQPQLWNGAVSWPHLQLPGGILVPWSTREGRVNKALDDAFGEREPPESACRAGGQR